MRVNFGGPSGPLIVAINSIVNFQLMVRVYYTDEKEYELMNLLTIAGIKESLEYIRDHADVKYHVSGPRKGMIVSPEDFSSEQAYSLFLVQKFTPQLVTQFRENVTGLTLDGQELLDILSDDIYLAKISDDLKTIGYTSPSDRQIFREVRRRMDIIDFAKPTASVGSAKELFLEFFSAAREVNTLPLKVVSEKTEQLETFAELNDNASLESIKDVTTVQTLQVEIPDVEEAETAKAESDDIVGSGLLTKNPGINVQSGRGDKRKNKS